MKEVVKGLCGTMTPGRELNRSASNDDLIDTVVSINKKKLDEKENVIKYRKARVMHSDILNNMEKYALSDKYKMKKYMGIVKSELRRLEKNCNLSFNLENPDEEAVFIELFVYKNHKDIPSLTEIYLKKNRFNNPDKVKMLEAMRDSFVSIFKIVGHDRENGYVTCQDVFTEKEYRIIDIGLSSTLSLNKNVVFYFYNRIITYEDIAFGTNIHCNFTSNCKLMMEFIENPENRKYDDLTRCLLISDICKSNNELRPRYNGYYG